MLKQIIKSPLTWIFLGMFLLAGILELIRNYTDMKFPLGVIVFPIGALILIGGFIINRIKKKNK